MDNRAGMGALETTKVAHRFIVRSRKRNNLRRPPIHEHETSSQPPPRERGIGRIQSTGDGAQWEGEGGHRSGGIKIRVRITEGNEGMERGSHWKVRIPKRGRSAKQRREEKGAGEGTQPRSIGVFFFFMRRFKGAFGTRQFRLWSNSYLSVLPAL